MGSDSAKPGRSQGGRGRRRSCHQRGRSPAHPVAARHHRQGEPHADGAISETDRGQQDARHSRGGAIRRWAAPIADLSLSPPRSASPPYRNTSSRPPPCSPPPTGIGSPESRSPPRARASATIRSTACSRTSAMSLVYSYTSPPARLRRLAIMSFPTWRTRTELPLTSPSVRSTRCPATVSVEARIIGGRSCRDRSRTPGTGPRSPGREEPESR